MACLTRAQDAPGTLPPDQAPVPASTPAPASGPPAFALGPIDFGGLLDGYYNWNFNHPVAGNQLYNFDAFANQFALNMAKLSISHTANPVGFEIDIGFGQGFDIIHATDPARTIPFLRNIEQAYFSWKPLQGRALELDFGQFVSSVGAEVFETNSNWNYSRSLLFASTPYYHSGVRLTDPIGNYFTGGVQIINGWDDTQDNNGGKSIGLVGNFAWKKLAWNNDYYVGSENPGTNKGIRHLVDSSLVFTPAEVFNAYVNFDYVHNRSYAQGVGLPQSWYGIALAAKYQFAAKMAVTPRIEWLDDRDAFATGRVQTVKEFTLTYEYKWVEGLISRLEYRHDWSNIEFFERGSLPNASKHQDTLTLALMAFFGHKR
jgi:Putative beta-barrel porin-2, OmpL-like. bbp2